MGRENLSILVSKEDHHMKTYLITYDLKLEKSGYEKAREKMISTIKTLGDSIHIASTTYLVKTSLLNASSVVEKLKPCVDGNDHLFVMQLCKDRQGLLTKEKWEWIDFLSDPRSGAVGLAYASSF